MCNLDTKQCGDGRIDNFNTFPENFKDFQGKHDPGPALSLMSSAFPWPIIPTLIASSKFLRYHPIKNPGY